jgi:hypothetical protein
MARDEHIIDHLFRNLDEEEKVELLRAAGIRDDRPGVLRDEGGSFADLYEWIEPHRKAITPLLLRSRNLTNRDVLELVEDGDFYAGRTARRSQIIVRLSPAVSSGNILRESRNDPNRVVLTHLAAASAMMSEMFIVLGRANIVLSREEPVNPPEVSVSSGSIEFAVGGGLFASGIGLIVACSAGLIATPVVGIAAGVTLASVGILELAIDWKKKIAETNKSEEEVRVLRLEHDTIYIYQTKRLRDLEIRAKELELEMARVRKQEMDKEQSRFAYSSLIPRESVIAQAKRWGVSEEYANHILNRGLPTYVALKQYFAEIEVKERDEPRSE